VRGTTEVSRLRLVDCVSLLIAVMKLSHPVKLLESNIDFRNSIADARLVSIIKTVVLYKLLVSKADTISFYGNTEYSLEDIDGLVPVYGSPFVPCLDGPHLASRYKILIRNVMALQQRQLN
jgi:hypothetical protein